MTAGLILLTVGFGLAALYCSRWRLLWLRQGLFWQAGVWLGWGKPRPLRPDLARLRRRSRPARGGRQRERRRWLLRLLWQLRRYLRLDELYWQPAGPSRCIVSLQGGDIIRSIWQAGRRKRHDR